MCHFKILWYLVCVRRVGQDWCWLLAETWAGTGAAPTLLPLLYNFYLYHWCSKALPSSYFTIIPHPLASPCSSVKTAILYDIHPATFSLPDPLPFYLHVTSTGTFSFKPWRVQQDMCLWETLELFTEHIIEHLYSYTLCPILEDLHSSRNFSFGVLSSCWHPEYLFCRGKLNDLLFQRLTDHSNSPPQSSTYSWSRELEIEINFTCWISRI